MDLLPFSFCLFFFTRLGQLNLFMHEQLVLGYHYISSVCFYYTSSRQPYPTHSPTWFLGIGVILRLILCWEDWTWEMEMNVSTDSFFGN